MAKVSKRKIYQHMFGALHRLKSNEGNLHRKQSTQSVHCTVRNINTVRKATSQDERQYMERNQVDKKDISTP